MRNFEHFFGCVATETHLRGPPRKKKRDQVLICLLGGGGFYKPSRSRILLLQVWFQIR